MRRSIRSIGRGAAAAALATSVVLGLGVSAASAQSISLRDAHHDTWKTTDSGADFNADPAQVDGDVLRATLRYGGKNVVLTEKFADLARVDAGDVYELALRTNTHLRRLVQVKVFSFDWRGQVAIHRPNHNSVDLPCDGLAEHIDYARNLLTVTVPRTCLDNPRWVQFIALNAHVQTKTTYWYDNPENAKAVPRGWSARVHRG